MFLGRPRAFYDVSRETTRIWVYFEYIYFCVIFDKIYHTDKYIGPRNQLMEQIDNASVLWHKNK